METLFELVKLYATNIRSRNLDGFTSWNNLKDKLKDDNHKCEWNLKFLNKDYQSTYDYFYNTLGMHGEEGDDEKKQDKKSWEKKHFYLQLIRIPKNNECNLIRLCQIAYNIGQF